MQLSVECELWLELLTCYCFMIYYQKTTVN